MLITELQNKSFTMVISRDTQSLTPDALSRYSPQSGLRITQSPETTYNWSNFSSQAPALPRFQEIKSLEDGWSGFGSEAPSALVISKAELLYRLVFQRYGSQLPKARIVPGLDDYVALKWKNRDPRIDLSILVYGEKYRLVIEQEGQEPLYKTTTDVSALYEDIEAYINQIG